MSSYYITAKNRETGAIEKVAAIDDFFRAHEYGYAPNYEFGTKPYPPYGVLTVEQFEAQYERVDMNQSHPEKAEKLERVGEQFGAAIRELGRESQPEKAERGIEEIMRECDVLFDGIELAKSWFRKQITGIHQSHHQELQKARTAEQERVVGIIDNVPSEKLIQTLIDRGYTKIEELTD